MTSLLLEGTSPSLLKLHRIVSGGGCKVDLSSVLAEQNKREVQKKETNLDSVSSKITVTYLPIVNALIREDTRRLFVCDPVQTIGGSKLMAAFGNSGLVSLKEIQYRLKHYLYRREQDVTTDLTHLITCTRSSLGQGDSKDLVFYVEHMFTYYRSLVMSATNKPPPLLQLIEYPHIHALNMFDPDLYMTKKRNHIEAVFNVAKLKEQMTELNSKVSMFKEYVVAMKQPFPSSPSLCSSNDQEEEEEEEEEQPEEEQPEEEQPEEEQPEEEEEERESFPPPKRRNICYGPPPVATQEEKTMGTLAMMNHLPSVAAMMTSKVLKEKPRQRKFSEVDKIKISQDVASLKPEFAKHLAVIFAKHNVADLRSDDSDELLVPTLDDLHRLSVDVLHEIQQYTKCVKTLTKERKKPGRKPKNRLID